MPARFKHRHARRCQAAPWAGERQGRMVPLLPRMRGLSGAASRHPPPSSASPPSRFSSVTRQHGQPHRTRSRTHRDGTPAESPWVLLPRKFFPLMHGDGEGGRQCGSPGCCIPAAASARRGWNGRPHRRHICWAGGPGIWDIVFLAGSGGCQKPDKLITSDMGQSSFWRAQAGPPEPLSGDGAAATQKFIIQRGCP